MRCCGDGCMKFGRFKVSCSLTKTAKRVVLRDGDHMQV